MSAPTASAKRGPKALLALFTSFLIAMSGLFIAPVTANAAPTATVTPVVSGIVDETSLTVSVNATDMPEGVTQAYGALIEKNVLPTLSGGYYAFVGYPFVVVSGGSASFSLTGNVSGTPYPALDRSKQYEVLVWQLHSDPNESPIYGRADVDITEAQWDRLFPPPPTPTATTTVWSSVPSAPVPAGNVTLEATVSPAAAGTVSFTSGVDTLGSGSVDTSTGKASATFPLAAGTHSISASFAPSDSAAFAASATLETATVVVEAGAPPVGPSALVFNLTASSGSASDGHSVGLVATSATNVPANTDAGKVQFYADGQPLGTPQSVKTTSRAAAVTANMVSKPTVNGASIVYTAVFTPTDPGAFAGSTTNTVTVTGTAATGPWNPAIEVFLKVDGAEVPYTGQQVYRGDELVVRGSGFDPEASVGGRGAPVPFGPQGSYVVFGNFTADGWHPSANKPTSTRSAKNQGWVLAESVLNTIPAMYQSTVRAQWVKPTAGAWSWSSGPLETPAAVADGEFGIYTYAAGGAVNAAEELEVLIDYVDAPRPSEPTTPVTPGAPALKVYLENGTTEYSGQQLQAGDKLVVKGTGFDPAANVPGGAGGQPIPNSLPQGTFVVFGSFAESWKPSTGAGTDARVMNSASRGWALDPEVLDQVPAQFQNAIRNGGYTPLSEQGEFTLQLTLTEPEKPLENGNWGIYSYAGGASGIFNASQEIAVPINFKSSKQPGPGQGEAGGALQWGFVSSWNSYVTGIASGTITASDGASKGADNVIGYTFASSNYDAKTGRGNILYRGTVVYESTAHGFKIAMKDPWITFTADGTTMTAEVSTDDTAGTADMSRVIVADLTGATPVAGEGGSLVWANVPATISSSIQPETWNGRYGGRPGTPVSFSLDGAEPPVQTPRVVVQGSVADLDPEAEHVVTVKGSGFLPAGAATTGTRRPLAGKFTGVYVAFGSYAHAWQPSTGAAASTRAGVDVKWAVPAESMQTIGGDRAGAIELKADGTFETQLRITHDEAKAIAGGSWGIVTYPGGGAKHAPFETFTAVTFAGAQPVDPVEPETPVIPTPGPGTLIWGVSSDFESYVTGPIAKGRVVTEGVDSSAGGYLFPQSSSSWDATTRTGTVSFSGSITYLGHETPAGSGNWLLRETFASPVITVTSPISGTITAGGQSFPLNLASAGFAENADGSVTWSNVRVSGGISGGGNGGGGAVTMDSLSFTVGSVNPTNFGSTVTTSPSAQPRAAAPTPPSTSGVSLVTPEDKLVDGGEIEITASGFQPNETGILVVIYSDPVVLDDNAKADANGVVRWIGKLPAGLVGTHTITLQGSIAAGKQIVIAAAQAVKAEPKQATVVPQPAAAAAEAPAEGAPVWLWWTGALALLVIAGAGTGLVVAQRRRNQAAGEL